MITFTKNFTAEELGCTLHPFLLAFLQTWRDVHDAPIYITSSLRTFQEHVDIYKKQYPKNWYEKVTLGSAHLPQVLDEGVISPYCHAVDFAFWNTEDHRDMAEEIVKFISTTWIASMFPVEAEAYGLGIAKDFIHLDCAPHRKCRTAWGY